MLFVQILKDNSFKAFSRPLLAQLLSPLIVPDGRRFFFDRRNPNLPVSEKEEKPLKIKITDIEPEHDDTTAQSSTKQVDESSPSLPPPWENPWLYALGRPQPPPKYTEVVESKEEFKWVKLLQPLPYIPEVPKHESYPTPSGWRPPRDPPPDLPYYVRRNRHHIFEIHLERRRDTLDTITVEFNYVELVVMRNVVGDVYACERDLKKYLEDKVGHPVGTHVNEPQGKIRIKGADRTLVEQFLWDSGF